MKTCCFFAILLCYQSGTSMGDMKLSIDATGDSKVEPEYVGGVRSTKGRTTTAGGDKLAIATADPLAKAPMARTPKSRLSTEVHGDGSFTQAAPHAELLQKHVAGAEARQPPWTPQGSWSVAYGGAKCNPAGGLAMFSSPAGSSTVDYIPRCKVKCEQQPGCEYVSIDLNNGDCYFDSTCASQTTAGFFGNVYELAVTTTTTTTIPVQVVWTLGTTASASPALRSCDDVCSNVAMSCHDDDSFMMGLSDSEMSAAVAAAGGSCSAVNAGGQAAAPFLDGACFKMDGSQPNGFDCAASPDQYRPSAQRVCPCVVVTDPHPGLMEVTTILTTIYASGGCTGFWTDGGCDAPCGGGDLTRNYTIPASNGGACPHADGESETTSCNTQACNVVWTLASNLWAVPNLQSCDAACSNAGMVCHDDGRILGMSAADLQSAALASGLSGCPNVFPNSSPAAPFIDGACYRKVGGGIFDCAAVYGGGSAKRICPCVAAR